MDEKIPSFRNQQGSEKRNQIIIAHRGESFDAPENTMAAINLAWERNADAVEIDVHLSKDGKIVVIHDHNTWRVSGSFKNVKDHALAELKCLDVGKHKGRQWLNERIPTLEEVIATVPRNKYLFVEIKCGAEILPALKNAIEKSTLRSDQVKLIGFNRDTMRETKHYLLEHEVFWVNELVTDIYFNPYKSDLRELIDGAKQAGLDGLDLEACEAIDKNFVNQIKANEMKLYVWTVNDPIAAKRLIDAGVDGIATDRAQWLNIQLENQN